MRELLRSPHVKVIPRKTVAEELRSLVPLEVACDAFDFGLHVKPNSRTRSLLEAISDVPASIDIVMLGYGLCSQAGVGLRWDAGTLVVPRGDACIGIFLGLDEARRTPIAMGPSHLLSDGGMERGRVWASRPVRRRGRTVR